MVEKQPSIEDVRAAHEGMLHLVELGAACACPSGDPYNPNLVAACHATAEQLATAIPPAELQRIFRECERQFVAHDN